MSAAHVGRRTRKIPYKKEGKALTSDANSNINVTPLVDVCLVLLIIFMVVTPMLGRGRDVELPKLVEADLHKEGDQVFVSVDDTGVWVNQDAYTSKGDFQEVLVSELKTAAGKAKASNYNGPILFLKGDSATNWGRVRVVMEWIKETEYENIALVVEVQP
jgi:biopolymer transport protein ExbD